MDRESIRDGGFRLERAWMKMTPGFCRMRKACPAGMEHPSVMKNSIIGWNFEKQL
jgi:hypothetical protein